MIATFPFSYFVFLKYGKILKDKNREIAKANDDYFSDMQESISGIIEIKGFTILMLVFEGLLFSVYILGGYDLRIKYGINFIIYLFLFCVPYAHFIYKKGSEDD